MVVFQVLPSLAFAGKDGPKCLDGFRGDAVKLLAYDTAFAECERLPLCRVCR